MERPARRISILWLMTGATLLPVLTLGAILFWLTTRSASRASETLGRQVLNEASNRVEESTQRYLERANRLSESLTSLLKKHTIDANDITIWRDRMFAHMRANPELASIQFVNARNECAYLSRYPGGLEFGIAQAMSSAETAPPPLLCFRAQIDGTLDIASRRQTGNDPRQRPWYLSALASRDPSWTRPYRWTLGAEDDAPGEWGVAYTRSVYDDAGRFLGILAIDLSFSQFSEYLADIAQPTAARMELRSDTGQLLALSHRQGAGDPDPVFVALEKQFRPYTGPVATDPVRLQVGDAWYVASEKLLWASTQETWRLVTAIPEDPVMAGARADLTRMTAISLAALFGAAVIAVWVGRLVSRPIRQLAAFAHQIGEGDFDRRLHVGGSTSEVAQLSSALNLMAAGLRDRVTLLAQKDAALEAAGIKSRLIAHVSHEFRTPLNAIIGYGELLQSSAESERRTQDATDAANILTASSHLLTLINNLLDLSRAEAGRLSLDLTAFDVQTLLDEVDATVRPVIEKQRNRFLVEPIESGLRMTSDPGRLKQILLNLLANSAKFTSDGTISLHVWPDDDSIVFDVVDTGSGVAPEDLARIFEPFQQIHRPGVPSHDGAGLGLAITRQLVQLLRGQIELHSAPGQGTRVRVTLPLDLPDTASRPLEPVVFERSVR